MDNLLEARKPKGRSLLKNSFVASSGNVVRRQVQRTRVSPLKYLRFTPGQDLEVAPYMNNADACAIASQVRRQLSRTIPDYGISEVHIFAAVPQALATMLGHSMNTMPPGTYMQMGRVASTLSAPPSPPERTFHSALPPSGEDPLPPAHPGCLRRGLLCVGQAKRPFRTRHEEGPHR